MTVMTQHETFRNNFTILVLVSAESASVNSTNAAGFLFLCAAPIKEPIANYGQFVINTKEEIQQAIEDYRAGVLTD